ncbi:hypothetical protein DIURU_004637 [Diutina rugosa]|uniref:Uncharacterized protein n=1 Tax=Diutina rugosa TaxID=5481 RepID=A0A642UNG2_DIURU|nr:uncharacterized protein DIURU_004637 [Diutina rugosa]KAA8898617.1 hypothetical protein DIURU_004637 [Diutina rugosa]
MPEGKGRFKKLTTLSGWTQAPSSPKKPQPAPAPSFYQPAQEPEPTGLKKLTAGDKWESPFRGQEGEQQKPKANPYQQFKEGNKLDAITVPEKFRTQRRPAAGAARPAAAKAAAKPATAATGAAADKTKDAKTAADAKDVKAEEAKDVKAVVPVTDTNASTKSLKDEPVNDLESERPLTAAERESAKPKDDEKLITDEDDVTDAPKEKLITDETANPAVESADYADVDEDSQQLKELADNPEVAENVEEAAELEVEAEKAGNQADALEEKREEVVDELGVTGEAVSVSGDPTDAIVERIKKDPPSLTSIPQTEKYSKIEEDSRYEEFKDRPAMLKRYQELSEQGVSASTSTADDPNALIDLGGGLKMKQSDLLAMAAKRVAPVLANINDAVGKTRDDDEARRQLDIQHKAKGHENSLLAELDKFKGKLGKKHEKRAKVVGEHKENINRMKKGVEARDAEYQKKINDEIDQLHKDSASRETKAAEKHESDRDTVHKNHEELVATKKQELEDAKTKHAETTTKIEELEEAKSKYHDENSELRTKLEALQAKVDEEQVKVDKVKGEYEEEAAVVAKNKEKIAGLRTKISESKETVETKRHERDGLKQAVDVLAASIAGYSAKLATLQNDKEARQVRLNDAQQKRSDWENQKASMAAEVAAEHERQRLQAQHEAETKKVQRELELNQLKEEQAVAEERERLLRLKEEREAQERARADAETKRQDRVKKREAERAQLLEEKSKLDAEYTAAEAQRKKELDQLALEIDQLKSNQSERALDLKANAERAIAELEAEQEQLRAEHEENMRLYQEKLDLEELQKSRLKKEGEHSARLAELQAERRRVAEASGEDAYPADLKAKIEALQKENEILNKKILNDDDSYKDKKRVVDTTELDHAQKNPPKTGQQKYRSLLDPPKNKSSTSVASGKSGSSSKDSSWNRLKKKFSREDPPKAVPAPVAGQSSASKQRSAAASTPAKEALAVPAVPKNTTPLTRKDSVGVASSAASSAASEYETYSVYEEVSSEEFERNKHNPDYFQVSHEEFERHNKPHVEETA